MMLVNDVSVIYLGYPTSPRVPPAPPTLRGYPVRDGEAKPPDRWSMVWLFYAAVNKTESVLDFTEIDP